MAAEHQFFYEDEVYRINKKGNVEFGMVLENSELVSSDENSDIEEGGRMKKGHIRVAWHPTGVEVIPERKVHLADRSLMPGDVVRRMIKGKDTQRGYCRDIKVTANVQVVGTKQVIPNVKSEHLIPLEEFATDIAACLDSWVGGIKSVHSKLHVQLADGSKCVINDLEACGLEDFTEKRGDCDCEFTSHREDFYPGQTLWGPLHCLEDAEWIHCTKEMKALRNKPNKTVKVVVEEVKTDCVGVHWQCRAYSKEGAGVEKEQPKYLVQGDDLKRLRLLNVFEPCTLQVGDRNFYTYREEDTYIQKEQWRRSQRELVLTFTNGINSSPISAIKRSPKRCRTKDPQAHVEGSSIAPSPMVVADTQVSSENPDNSAPTAPAVVPMEVTPGGGEEEEWDTEDTASVSDAASISSGASSIGSQGRKKRGPALMTKVLKKKKLRRTRKKLPPMPLTQGMRIVVETLSTSSIADVVWQDGSVELGIPSTQLYPIHHLDDQEFFPGDFVIENKEDSCMQVYGVVQSVDHAGRTAAVKWFKTYTSVEQPQPSFIEQNEVSVYDLKDHPDFQYRPGTVVIRVANFEGEDVNCTAGQVLDNYPEGMVRVWWVDGHISMSWPQDLYKVGEYDSDEGELWDDNSSDASWETESEDCVVFDDDKYPEEDLQEILKPKLAANIEKARIAMSRLEEIFTQNPALQTTSVMRQLLDVYKDCRYLDRLMGTSFFHESHFQGLLERVRERGRANVAQRVADQVNRLFSTESADTDITTTNIDGTGATKGGFKIADESFVVSQSKDKISNELIECKLTCNSKSQEDSGISSSTSNKDSCGSSANESFTSGEFLLSENLVNLERHVVTAANNSKNNESFALEENSKETKESKIGLRTIGFTKQRCLDEKMEALKHTCHTPASIAIDQSNTDKKSEGLEITNSTTVDSVQTRSGPWSVSNSHVCVRLCSLIKAQLVKAHGEVTRRFGGNQGLMALSEALNEPTEVPISNGDQNGGQSGDQTGDKTGDQNGDQNGDEVAEATEKDSLNIGLRSLLCSKSSPLICGNPGANAEIPVAQETDTTVAAENSAVEKGDFLTPTVVEVPLDIPGETPVSAEEQVTAEKEKKEVESSVSPEESQREAFSILDSAPNSHKFKLTMFQPTDPPNFFRTVRKELKLLRSSLPEGIWVKGFEDRMDLYSVMIRGPEKTPYEGGLFFFDFQLSADYPKAPPLCHYISYCSDRLNPNLYEDGKVCVSLLGTWSGKGTEVWTSNSNLLQVIVSIQGLILVSEPYFNEAGYEKQKGSQQGKENSRMYNEMAVLKLVQAMTKLILQPPPIFKEEILDHFRDNSGRLLHRLDTWLEISERYNNNHPITPTTPTSFRELHGEAIASAVNVQLPEFPLIPASKGFCLTLRKTLVTFRDILGSVGITPQPPPS